MRVANRLGRDRAVATAVHDDEAGIEGRGGVDRRDVVEWVRVRNDFVRRVDGRVRRYIFASAPEYRDCRDRHPQAMTHGVNRPQADGATQPLGSKQHIVGHTHPVPPQKHLLAGVQPPAQYLPSQQLAAPGYFPTSPQVAGATSGHPPSDQFFASEAAGIPSTGGLSRKLASATGSSTIARPPQQERNKRVYTAAPFTIGKRRHVVGARCRECTGARGASW